MRRSFGIALFFIFLIYKDVGAQSLDSIISLINDRYSGFKYFSYDVLSFQKSLMADTIKFSYSTKVSCDKSADNNALGDFICTNKFGNPLYLYYDNELMYFDSLDQSTNSYSLQPPYRKLKQGEIRWATFSPLIFNPSLIDTTKWNEANSDYEILISGDTLDIFMCNTFENEPLFFKDDPLIGYKSIRLQFHSKSYVLFEAEEVLMISKKPELYKYIISNFRVYPDGKNFESLKSEIKTIVDSSNKVAHPDLGALIKKNRLDIEDTFNDTFKIFNLATNHPTRIADLDSRYILLDFWFTGCIPCREADKIIKKLEKNILEKGIHCVGINFVDTSIKKMRSAFPDSSDLTNQYYVMSRKEVPFLDWYGAPTLVIYDRLERRVLKTFTGFNDQYEQRILGFLASFTP